MARRLEQLHAALGETEFPPAKAVEIKNQLATVDSGKSFGTGSLIATALIAALFGAGMMWLGTPVLATPPYATQTPAALPVALPRAPELTLPAPAAVAATVEINEKAQVGERLEDWRKAWAQRDLTGYLSAYSQQFAPTDGTPRAAWVAARSKKLAAGAPIAIEIRELGIERINADQFKATFLQDYVSGNYRDMARTKVLLIARENGEWKIIREWMAEAGLAAK